MIKKLLFIIPMLLIALAFTIYTAVNWKVKDDYSVRIFHNGDHFVSFRGLKADISFDESFPEKSRIFASVEAATIDADHNEAMKNGAEQADILDVSNHPEISFVATSVTKKDSAASGPAKRTLFLPGEAPMFKYLAKGKLTLKGVTKEIWLPFKFENEVFKGGFTIHPADFNITNENFQKDLNVVLYVPVTK